MHVHVRVRLCLLPSYVAARLDMQGEMKYEHVEGFLPKGEAPLFITPTPLYCDGNGTAVTNVTVRNGSIGSSSGAYVCMEKSFLRCDCTVAVGAGQ